MKNQKGFRYSVKSMFAKDSKSIQELNNDIIITFENNISDMEIMESEGIMDYEEYIDNIIDHIVETHNFRDFDYYIKENILHVIFEKADVKTIIENLNKCNDTQNVEKYLTASNINYLIEDNTLAIEYDGLIKLDLNKLGNLTATDIILAL